MLNLSQTLLTLIKRLETELKEIQEFMNSDDHEDDDWENTREYYEIAEDELLDQIKCLRSFETNFPSIYIGDNKASIVEELIVKCKSRLKGLLETQDSRIEKEIQTLREEIKLLAEILAVR